ncbi:Stk1 family PASTA domain-containing Ser/Thr kinase [Thalassorhabdus alkalitolerans]|uniref:non-specific serine/threonine protein kinase n=1 Tax=Thalassorhabdus alkalitolerans TaxID=2282697 RepID=A0ABW0YKL2_9BACI
MAGLIGKRINERYQIHALIGGGGMAHVYKATDMILEREVAVKVLQPQFVNDEEFIRRFHREAQAATSLFHPNIVDIYDVGEEEDLYYIVMEYIDGSTLKEYIQQQGPLPVNKVINIMSSVLSAIVHAHANQIIHRDIKPHNILIDKHGDAKVTDFGIARAASAATITHTNSVLGSVHYLSPEQARGGTVTAKSDIYSLGIVLFEMVTGEVPFNGESAVSIAIKQLQEPLPFAKELRPDLPQSIENVIIQATAKDPFHRYGSVQDMNEDLSTALWPERQSESRYIAPADDEEATKAVPVIKDTTENMGETKVAGTEKGPAPSASASNPPPAPAKGKKKKKWVLPIVLFFVILAGSFATAFTVIPGWLMVQDVDVPNLEGLTLEEAEEELQEAGLTGNVERVYDEEVEEGFVIRQRPQAGSTVKVESQVNVFVSQGREMIEMPDVTGLAREEAETLLEDFENVEFSSVETTDTPLNVIVEQDPVAGEELIADETNVQLTYSVPAEVSIPNLRGETMETINNYLESEGLAGRFEEEHSDLYDEGRVIDHDPGPYERIQVGDEILFIMSLGPEEEEQEDAIDEEEQEELREEEAVDEEDSEDSEENEVTEEVEAVIPIEMSEEEMEEGVTFDVRLTYEDATTSEPAVFVEETISESRTYQIPLIVTPEEEGSYTLYIDDEEIQSNSFTYGD